MKAHETAPILKKFLYEKIGFENISNGIVSVIDEYTLAFKIREMSFMLDCETMTVIRVIKQGEGQTVVTYSHTDTICAMVERGVKEYICTFIEKLQGKMEKYNQY